MAAVAERLLMTVKQYREIPARDDVIRELHWGQAIASTRPKARHVKLQSRLVRLLRPRAEHLGYVESELPFRAKWQTVTITNREGASVVYRGEDRIPLRLLGGDLVVSEVFARG